MEPEVVRMDPFIVMGVQSGTPYESDNFGPIWQQYMAHNDDVEPHSVDGACYGINYEEAGTMTFLAGIAVKDVTEAPEGVVLSRVPGGRYAVFACSVGTIHDTYDFVFHRWLATPEHEKDPSRPCFERYGPGTTSVESPVDIDVPLAD
jgi:predicted transcriptional regulator YdeE